MTETKSLRRYQASMANSKFSTGDGVTLKSSVVSLMSHFPHTLAVMKNLDWKDVRRQLSQSLKQPEEKWKFKRRKWSVLTERLSKSGETITQRRLNSSWSSSECASEKAARLKKKSGNGSREDLSCCYITQRAFLLKNIMKRRSSLNLWSLTFQSAVRLEK